MDLRELSGATRSRHPWERARVQALRRVLGDAPLGSNIDVLDVGCGDGFAAESLRAYLPLQTLTGLDVNFTDAHLQAMRRDHPGTRYVRRWEDLGGRRFDLVLLLDVIEHVQHDAALLARATRHVAHDGLVLLTAPALSFLFSDLDRRLRHHRRYWRTELCGICRQAGLRPLSSGYFFSSLVLPRLVSVALERLSIECGTGDLGQWQHGELLSRMVTRVLELDNRMLLALREIGLTLPGLSTWALCCSSAA